MYLKAYELKQLKEFNEWDILCSEKAASLKSDHTVYLREDFTVYSNSFCNDENLIFHNISSEWMDFCKSTLLFPIELFSLHTYNKNFKWKSYGALSFLSKEQAQFYDTYGYLVIEKAFNEEIISEVTQEIDVLEAQVEEALKKMENGKGFIGRANEITFSTHLVKKSQLLKDFCSSKIFQDISRDLIGPNVRLYWDHAVYKKPGVQECFPWHQDNGYTFLDPQQYLTCWVALTDADENNGCFWVAPFIHKLGTLSHRLTDLGHICYEETPATAISLPAKKGDMIVMSAILPHMTGPNHTSMTRKGYVIQFCSTDSFAITPDGKGGESHIPANIEDRQYEILKEGVPAGC